mmetsp:Transcript_23706/g.36451  ORF Transcript_23706/g.36451 Transcript_23706/m.36451 type:complete len:370 (+) Transcript_23706:274-1383(+)|eukprot:CAMPEP_0118699690 /NCGR_PEP_ID=MMETSP0800-20121206/16064_1 /TAXON_ID=210618 ORGANISM="Striatella unipunctata, Strain CCMP2910" /NCGR_SAMPLE_ID=MMETSP0800 /ASSEMBLY_ACC=CAM_ASM_000638 /LENGTH=369 /DNA_ID=CAMNT_0006599985 /DNA_START=245 /DNA_END=1354 /DNA_ORIENTATION=+
MSNGNNIDMSKVTHAATTDIADLLNPTGPRVMPMPGFEDTFVDIVDYILRITYWIWHEKKVDLCLTYYSPTSVLHTMTGDIIGNQTVVDNTWATLKSFPDRTLDGENVVWSYNGETYFSSHLIVSHMTNDGPSEFGPATHKRARIRTIADCICKENLIIEEWLMRDNCFLVQTLGYDPWEIAKKQAEGDIAKGFDLLEFLAEQREKVIQGSVKEVVWNPEEMTAETHPSVFSEALFLNLWQNQEFDNLSAFYDFRVTAHLTAGRELYGTMEMKEYLQDFLGGLTNVAVKIENVATIPYLGKAVDVAVRWTMTAQHSGDSKVLGSASDTPIFLLASSHFRIVRGRVREEWTVFDELALYRQVATKRLQKE